MTVGELKRALFEVSTICSKFEPICGKTACPFYSETRSGCSLDGYRPDFWDTADWKEDAKHDD